LGENDKVDNRNPVLRDRLEQMDDLEFDRDRILEHFLDYVTGLGLELYAAQEESILEFFSGKHVILSTPTGSGKSLVALAMHFLARAEKKISYYTAPTKALVNEKFFSLCDALGPKNVGMLTGDASVNRDAPTICCTAEILSNLALRQDDVEVDYVVMDEFHFYGDKDRGAAWQIPLISMKNTIFLLMSATLGDISNIEKRLFEYTSRKVAVVSSVYRPVPLEFQYRDNPLHESIEDLLQKGKAPIYLVNFTQRAATEQAQNLCSINMCSKEDKKAIASELKDMKFDSPFGKDFSRFIRHGIGVHHAGLLPKYRRVVERLAGAGLIQVISGTDTLGVGVNIPIRSVVLSQLYKFNGEKAAILSAREFHQISGRAGRKGFDDVGFVVAQAPEWSIENKRIAAKVAKNPHLKKKLVKKKPPPRAVHWDQNLFESLLGKAPEMLMPQFLVNHSMLINLLQNDPLDGYRRLVRLIGRSHGTPSDRKFRRRRAAMLYRTLLNADIVSIHSDANGRKCIRLRPDLQDDFSLMHTLSLYLVEAIDLLDPNSPELGLDMLSLIESILEEPRVVLYSQIRRLKNELVARLKAEGVEYEERMIRLEKVTHPKPNADFIYSTFNAFAKGHPWIDGENIRPKSIAREMYERCMNFNDYVREYGLARSEGVLLRYLSQVYKTAVQNVPESAWCEEFEDILAFFYGLINRIDSSLIQEWELLVSGPREVSRSHTVSDQPPQDITCDSRAFVARVRNELQVFVKCLADKDYETACRLIHHSDENQWTPESLESEMAAYYAEYDSVDVSPVARGARNTIIAEVGHRVWTANQKLIDPEGHEDTLVFCVIDLREPRDLKGPLIELRRIG
jgi:superfamily II DNA/RNA helicase